MFATDDKAAAEFMLVQLVNNKENLDTALTNAHKHIGTLIASKQYAQAAEAMGFIARMYAICAQAFENRKQVH